jgi:hypothetical protein
MNNYLKGHNWQWYTLKLFLLILIISIIIFSILYPPVLFVVGGTIFVVLFCGFLAYIIGEAK